MKAETTVYSVTSGERKVRLWAEVVLALLIVAMVIFLGNDLRRMQKVAAAAQAKADREALRLELIVASSPWATMMCTESGRIVQSNLAAELLLGWKHEDIVGQQSIVLIPEADRAAHRSGMEKSAKKMRELDGNKMILSRDKPLMALHKNGSLVPVIASIRAIKFAGEIEFIVTMKADAPLTPPIPPSQPVPLPELPMGNVSIERAIIQMAAEK